MIDISTIDYSELDRPEILSFLFYPRPDFGEPMDSEGIRDMLIPVDENDSVGARLHVSNRTDPTILFFHGNGETVSDYDDMGSLYTGLGINFLPVDYRGYGRSSGTPTITSMMRDCHVVLDFVKNVLTQEGYNGSLIVMGRSLGSASALELAGHYRESIDGLVVESGFASMEGLYQRLSAPSNIPESKRKGLSNVDKIARFDGPTLVIHAEFDHIIPFAAGEELFEAAAASEKTFLKIPGADHNDIFFRGRTQYLEAVLDLVEKANLSKQENAE